MMKFNEMSTERKAVVVVGNVLFFGGLILKRVVPGIPHIDLITAIEFAGLAVEMLAYCRLGKAVI